MELLISSNVSRYTEFKSVSRVLTLIEGSLVHVPSSRADVFQTRAVSVVEKRILMKFLTLCHDLPSMSEEEASARIAQFRERRFREFLKHERLTDNLVHFVMHSIAMVGEDATTQEGLAATAKFLTSLGRFGGSTPFLWPMYGAGEMPQAFCRLCAVFGGTYFLGRTIDGIVVSKEEDNNVCKAIIAQGNGRKTRHVLTPLKLNVALLFQGLVLIAASWCFRYLGRRLRTTQPQQPRINL